MRSDLQTMKDKERESAEEADDGTLLRIPLSSLDGVGQSHTKSGQSTPSLTSAVSQVSLANSELTASETDLNRLSSGVTSAASSRPASSSDNIPVELYLPHQNEYVRSPLPPKDNAALISHEMSVAGDLVGSGNLNLPAATTFFTPHSPQFFTPYSPQFLMSSVDKRALQAAIIQNDGFDEESDLEEDYFEEFHLPNTYENAFVRHQSFRKKVQSIPIDAPDAEKIEGLVRTGEFERHDSIRRKILPEMEEESDAEISKLSAEPYRKTSDNSEQLFTEEDLEDLISKQRSVLSNSLIANTLDEKNRKASTPNVSFGSEDDMIHLSNESFPNHYFDYDDSMTLEHITLMKIKECLDFSNYQNIYNLSGRLQDILSSKEIEEVLNNSHKYTEFIGSDVLEALSNSLQDQTHQKSNMDSGISSPRQPRKGTVGEDTSTGNWFPGKRDSMCNLFCSSTASEANDCSIVLETRCSKHFSRGGLEVEGVFVESRTVDPEKKVIKAPDLDLDSTCDDSDHQLPSPGLPSSLSNSGSIPRSVMSVSPSAGSEVDVEPSCQSSQESLDDAYQDMRIKGKRRIPAVAHLDSAAEDESSLELSLSCPRGDILLTPTCKESQPDSCRMNLPPVPPPPVQMIPELTATEETQEERHWRSVIIGGIWRSIDMKVIAPYRSCVCHGGYFGDSKTAIITLSACCLPHRSRKDYSYKMDNLFIYFLSVLEQVVSDDYIFIYFAEGPKGTSGPGFQWLKMAYQMINRKLRKNLKSLLVVHPTLWVRTVIAFSRPFISSKFYRKLLYISNLTELAQMIPLEQLQLPDAVKQVDFELMIREKKKNIARLGSVSR